MDYKTAIEAMRGYFSSNWGSTTPILYGDDDNSNLPNETWVRFNILHSDGNQATSGDPGNNRFDRFGIITVQVFAKQGGYGVDAVAKATDILKLYEGVENSGIFYFDATVREVGNDGRGWYQINVLTNFRYEEIT